MPKRTALQKKIFVNLSAHDAAWERIRLLTNMVKKQNHALRYVKDSEHHVELIQEAQELLTELEGK